MGILSIEKCKLGRTCKVCNGKISKGEQFILIKQGFGMRAVSINICSSCIHKTSEEIKNDGRNKEESMLSSS